MITTKRKNLPSLGRWLCFQSQYFIYDFSLLPVRKHSDLRQPLSTSCGKLIHHFGLGSEHRLLEAFPALTKSLSYAGSQFCARSLSILASDFVVSETDAKNEFEKKIRGHLLGPNTKQEDIVVVKAAFQPFWLFNAKLLYSARAEIGMNELQMQYDPRFRRVLPKLTTVWRKSPWMELSAKLEASNQEMQIYSSFKQPKELASWDVSSCLSTAKPFSSRMQTPDRETEEFDLSRDLAWELARENVTSGTLTLRSNEALRQMFGGEHVRNLEIRILSEAFSATAFYCPAYIVTHFHQSHRFVASVNGVTAEVSGVRLLSPIKAAAAALTLCATAGGLLLAVLPSSALWTPLLLLASTAVTGGAFLVGKMRPVIASLSMQSSHAAYVQRQLARGAGKRRFDQNPFEDSFFGSVFGELFRAASRQRSSGPGRDGTFQEFEWRWGPTGFETRSGSTQQQSSQGQQQQRPSMDQSRSGSDPKGYYKLLGISPGASPTEIKAAYRKLALKTHPDRETDPEKKAMAEKRFKAVSEAHQVLSDERERAKYDGYGVYS